MKVCILGKGLTSLTLAKSLANQGIYVDIFSEQKFENYNRLRTIAISKSNLEFFNNNIINIDKLCWKVKKIEIYSQNLGNEKILNFQNENEQLFSIIRNYKLYDLLKKDLKKNKFLQFKKDNKKIFYKKYKLVFNCNLISPITKKFFYKKISKNYNGYAYVTIIKHKKIINNNIASQFFTDGGPLAFLPISDEETSVVYSSKNYKNIDLNNLITKYNNKYSIIKIYENSKFKLKSLNLRSYKEDNILAFGDLLHKIHPLAGQGFNMSIRDIKFILALIKYKINLGLELDNSICEDFESKTRHKNYLFSNGIDFVYEFFNFENSLGSSTISRSVQILGKNKYINNLFTKFADKGIVI